MAKAKKTTRRYRRSRYTRRYSGRRRYRRKYYRRSGRRFPKNTEVKSKQFHASGSIDITRVEGSTNFTYIPGLVTTIGGSNTAANLVIAQGTGQNQRIGAKIEPVKLRISGCFSVSMPNTATAATSFYSPNFWQVRLIVYQVKGGNSARAPNIAEYHQMAIATTDGYVTGPEISKVYATYQSTSATTFSVNDWKMNNMIGKVPLRRGIGGICKVLYKKTFWINSQKNPVKQFRIITKCPKRLVYPETSTSGESESIYSNASNCIYILWVWQPGNWIPDAVPQLNFSFFTDFFFTDK